MKSHIANPEYIVYCMRIVCHNGLTVRLANYVEDLVVSGETYGAYSGFDFSGFEAGTGYTPGAIDLKGIIGFNDVTEAALVSGIFDDARAFVFATTWNDPYEGEEEVAQLIFGKTKIMVENYTVEMMSLIDLLNQSQSESFSEHCKKTFGGQELYGCKKDVVAMRVTGAVTGVTDNFEFLDNNRTEDSDYFGYGLIWFTTGANVNIPAKKIKWYVNSVEYGNGIFVIYEEDPFPFDIQVGDEYIAEPGCRKTEGACIAHGNILRFGGWSFVPGESVLKTVGAK